MKAEIQSKMYIILQVSALNLRLIATNLASILEHVCKVRDVNVQDNPTNGRWDTGGKAHALQVKCL